MSSDQTDLTPIGRLVQDRLRRDDLPIPGIIHGHDDDHDHDDDDNDDDDDFNDIDDTCKGDDDEYPGI